LIDQYPLKLRNSERWVSIVELDSDLVRELIPGALGLLEATDDVVEGSSAPEVLLLQAKLLTSVEATIVRHCLREPAIYSLVVRVQHGRDCLGTLLIGYGALVIARVELLEVKLAAGCLAAPKTEIVARAGLVSGNYFNQFHTSSNDF
jgi:hypothetical protein